MRVGLQGAQHGQAGHVGQVQVQQHQVGIAGRSQAGLAGAGAEQFDTGALFEPAAHHLDIGSPVFDVEHPADADRRPQGADE